MYKWIEDENLQYAVQEGKNRILDLAENKLATKISEGDTTSLIFFLKTQGKKRGYIEKQEIDNKISGSIANIELTQEEIKALNKELEGEC